MARLLFALLLLLAGSADAQWTGLKLDLHWASVGSPGNSCDPQPQGCFGAVSHEYQIGTFETTNTEYARFLNAVAAPDTNNLFDAAMAGDASNGGITRSEVAGRYVYYVKPGFENKPVTYVSFWDALRFVNWLYNGQPVGAQDDSTTEDGAYTLTPDGISTNSIARNAGAAIFLPSEDEWFKAAYYAGGASYFDYPAGSDAITSCTAPSASANAANCANAVLSVTDRGSYVGSPSPSATFDQGGNVAEWNEGAPTSTTRRAAGGWWGNLVNNLAASNRDYGTPASQGYWAGFRVARLGPPVEIVVSLDPGQTSPPFTWSLTISIAAAYDVVDVELLSTGLDSFAINTANPNIGGEPLTGFYDDAFGDGRDLLLLQSIAPGAGVAIVSGPVSNSLLGTFTSSSATVPPVLLEPCEEPYCESAVRPTDIQPFPPSEYTVRTVGPPAPDSDGDGTPDPTDNCPTIANADQLDTDADLVGDACDSCVAVANTRWPNSLLVTLPWVTLTGQQRDDDHDGYGNACDADFTPNGSIVGAPDLVQFRASNGKNRSTDTCGTTGTKPCAIFDIDGLNEVVGAGDLARFRLLNGKAAGPKCAACPLACESGASGSCDPVP